jgi:hypothetical protein
MTTQNSTTPIFFDDDFSSCNLEATTLAEAAAEVESYLRENALPQEWCYDYERFKSVEMRTTVCQRCPRAERQPNGEYECDNDCEQCFGQAYLEASEEVVVVIEPEQPLEDASAPDAFALVRTSFHGGGIVSHHKTEKGAQWALWRAFGDSECSCGCAVAVPVADLGSLPTADREPCVYNPAL